MSELEKPATPLPTEEPLEGQSQDYINSAIPLPKPPENPANTVPSKTLWMGDIEPWWDEDYIGQIWAKVGKRVLVKVIKPKQGLLMHQMASNGGQSSFNHSGYCFIEFDSPEDATEGLSFNGTIIPNANNKLFRLNWASAATLNSQIAQTPEFSLFVGDLSPGTTEAHLLSLFQTHFSTVKTVRVMTDPSTGLSRCFGFVRFSSEEDRKRALIEMNGKWLGGRPIRVALATAKHQNSLYHKNQQGGMGGPNPVGMPLDPMDQQSMYMAAAAAAAGQNGPGGPMAPPMGYYPPQGYAPSGPQSTPPLGGGQGGQGSAAAAAAAAAQAFNDPKNTTVFVGGLANGVSEETLFTLFEPFGQIIHVKVPPGKGCGFVKFTKREDAEQAIAGMQGFIIGGSRVRLSWGRSSTRNHQHQHHHLQQQQQQQMMMAGVGNPLSRGSFDFAAAAAQQGQLAPGSQPQGVDGYPPQGTPQGTPAGMVGIPAGLGPGPMFYDPYFGQPPQSTGSEGDNSQLLTGVPPQLAQQFAVDQNGQYMYVQHFPNPMMTAGQTGGSSDGSNGASGVQQGQTDQQPATQTESATEDTTADYSAVEVSTGEFI